MILYFRRAHIWIVLNLIGMTTYLYLGSNLQDEDGLSLDMANAIYWLVRMVPVLLVYLVFNLISLSAIIERVRQTGRLSSFYIWFAIAILWILTFRYDNLNFTPNPDGYIHLNTRFLAPLDENSKFSSFKLLETMYHEGAHFEWQEGAKAYHDFIYPFAAKNAHQTEREYQKLRAQLCQCPKK